MTLAEFHNGLRILHSIDFSELADAGAISDDPHGEAEWEHFRANPPRYFIAADDDQAEKIWAIINRRARPVTPALSPRMNKGARE